jgi:hypothetical protein
VRHDDVAASAFKCHIAMGCIYASHFRMVASKYILLPWGTWQCRVVASALQYLCCGTFSVCSWCSSLHDDATHTALQRVALRCSTSSSLPVCSSALAWRSHLLACLALLLFLPAHVAAQMAITDTNLNTAVIEWVTNPTTATTTYGPIADWNTAVVTSTANLLYPTVASAMWGTERPTFNGDISKWNVASVSNMYRVRLASV